MNTRAIAAKIIHRVVYGRSALDTAMAEHLPPGLSSSDMGFIHELCYGTLRFLFECQARINSLLHKPISQKNGLVACLLWIGSYQCYQLNTPAYAAISSTVDAAKQLNLGFAAGLINKILRLLWADHTNKLTTNKPTNNKSNKIENSVYYNHPDWLINKIQHDWPLIWEKLLEANNQIPPLVIRINPQRVSRGAYLERLIDANIPAVALDELPYAILIKERLNITQLPGFAEGDFYVQDSSGQFAGELLKLTPNLRVLDACAAPGSKTTDILLREPELAELVAVDMSPARLAKIQENITRLGLESAKLVLLAQAAETLHENYPQAYFDRILLDAPCSASGVIRRHPDIKILRTPKDIHQLVDKQLKLMNSLWPLLAKGGYLLYSTCSLFHEENDNLVDKFVKNTPTACVESIKLPSATALKHGVQCLTVGKLNADGFYYALLKKI
jgi:16S rRNA (cytosine967-C5)-methyltransferase